MKLHSPFIVAALIAAAVPTGFASAQDSRATVPVVFTTEQMDNLVAPIALYPDAILAQVLIASTFPDQIEFAAKYVRANGTKGIDDQSWDVSVKAVAHYAPVLNMLADRPDWATALGQAYAAQSSDVMESVQTLREMAREQGNLQSTSQQTVIVEDQNIRIVPAQPRVIYVPTYDPEYVYYNPMQYGGMYAGYWSFGVGFPIGAWLSYDCDWYGRRVYYDGWRGGGWRVAAYPFISINSFYVNPRYQTVYMNRDIGRRPVNYGNLGRYNTIHRSAPWDNRGRGNNNGYNNGYNGGNNGRNNNGNTNRSPGPIPRGTQPLPPRAAEPRVRPVEPSRRAPSWTLPPTQPSRRDQGNNDGRNSGGNDPRTTRDRTQTGRPPINDRQAPPPSRYSAPPPPPSRYSAPPPSRNALPPQTRNAPPPQARNAPPPQARNAPPPPSRNAPPPSRSSAPPSRGGDSKARGSSRGG